MNFNDLIPKYEMMRECARGGHAYYPSGHIEAVIGGSVAVRFRCKKCGSLITSFMGGDEYATHRHVIDNYIESKGVVRW